MDVSEFGLAERNGKWNYRDNRKRTAVVLVCDCNLRSRQNKKKKFRPNLHYTRSNEITLNIVSLSRRYA